MELVIEKWIEPSRGYLYPFDVLFQQVISICQEYNGITYDMLIEKISKNHIFHNLSTGDVKELIQDMIEKEFLEVIKGSHEMIVGLEGERILRSKNFYAVFMTPDEYEVIEGIKKIGRLDKAFIVNIGDNIILGGRLWRIKAIDYDRNKVYVSKAVSGKKPNYTGSSGYIHKKIGEKMMEILCSAKEFTYVNEGAAIALNDMRKKYNLNSITADQRVIWSDKDEGIFETYTGTTITRTLVWMLRYFGVDAKVKDGVGRITISKPTAITDLLQKMKEKKWSSDDLLPHVKEHELFKSKYSKYISKPLQIKMHIANEIDIEETVDYLQRYPFKCIDLG
jgi:ATP-dependent Lhr-like helicase